MTELEVAKIVAGIMACYPGQRFPEATAAAYEAFLIDLEHERCSRAVDSIVRSSKFVPTIAEIIGAYEALAHHQAPAVERARLALEAHNAGREDEIHDHDMLAKLAEGIG